MTRADEHGHRRVVHVLRDYLPYSQTWIHRQIGWLPPSEVAVVAERVVSPGPVGFPTRELFVLEASFPRAYRTLSWSPGRRLVPRLARCYLRGREPQVLHAHFGESGWRWLSLATRLGAALVTSFYGRDMSAQPRGAPVWRRRYRRLFACGTRFLCEGPVMARSLEALGCPRARIGIQRLGIDTTDIDVRARSRRPDERLAILLAARFTEKKGLPDAIAAAALAAREVDLEVTVVGDARPTPAGRREASRIDQAACASGLGDRLRFVGTLPHDELLAHAYRSHVFLQPSRTARNGDTEGGAPVTLLDLGATGLAAIATRHADIPDVVVHDATGWLVNEGDVPALAACLVRAAREPDLVQRMGERAADRVRDEFSAERCAATLRRHYDEAASSRVVPATRVARWRERLGGGRRA